MSDKTGVIINTVAFGEGGLEISYIETREQNPKVGMIRTMLYEVDEQWQARIDDILDSIEEVVEDGLVKIRNPQYVTRRSPQERARDIGRRNADDEDFDPEVDGREYGD